MLKTGIGWKIPIKIGNGGGGVVINGGIILYVKNVILFGINMKMKYKYLKNKELIF